MSWCVPSVGGRAPCFNAKVDPAHIDAYVSKAGDDVEDLWPSRDREDGALSLLATALESRLLTIDLPPQSVELTSRGTWLIRQRSAEKGTPEDG